MELKFCDDGKILIVSPHPDDESIGCGGLMKLYGKRVDVLLLTDGRKGTCSYVKDNEIIHTRYSEFCNAMEKAQISDFHCLNIPEGDIFRHKKIIKQFNWKKYKYIFVPNKHESHPDHRATYSVIKSIINLNSQELYQYEVWTPNLYPDTFLDISSVISEKAKIISCYASQLENINYTERICGLNRFRCSNLGKRDGCKYVEAYKKTEKFGKYLIKCIYHTLPIRTQLYLSKKLKKG